MSSRGRPYRRVEFEGCTILVGRSDDANDDLTFRVASRGDLWLHVAGCPGSHVVVHKPAQLPEYPRAVLLAAAGLAAWYSKARGATWATVHYCQVRDVRKIPGAPAGQVQLLRFNKLKVRPANIPPANSLPQTETL